MNQILLVEGKDDLFVFSNLFEKHQVKQSFKIIDKDGIEQLFLSISIHVKADNSTIGIVIDADSDISSRWDSLKSILSNLGYKVPNSPAINGTIISSNSLPSIGIWIMPDNDENGMLEDFVKELVPTNDKLMPIVESTLIDIETKSLNNYKLIHKSKAKIHTWLAWQESPGTPMGLAINKTYLETTSKMCTTFITWINKLYN
jgi:hypothetical protein